MKWAWSAGSVVVIVVVVLLLVLGRGDAGGLAPPRTQQIYLVNASGRPHPFELTSGALAHAMAMWLSPTRIAELAGRGTSSFITSQTTRSTDPERLSATISAPLFGAGVGFSRHSDMTAAAITDQEGTEDKLEILNRRRRVVVDRFADTGAGAPTPVWSPDGETLAYIRHTGPLSTNVGPVTAGPAQIALYDVKDKSRRILPSSRSGIGDGSGPVFSPAGTSLAYTVVPDAAQSGTLNVSQIAGQSSQVICSGVESFGLAWSPNGKMIALTGYRRDDSTPYLFIVDVKTRRLTAIAAQVQLLTPAWSPDSRQIAFSRSPGGRATAVTVIPAVGGPLRVVANAPGSDVEDVAWSPTGRQIAFTLQRAPSGD